METPLIALEYFNQINTFVFPLSSIRFLGPFKS